MTHFDHIEHVIRPVCPPGNCELLARIARSMSGPLPLRRRPTRPPAPHRGSEQPGHVHRVRAHVHGGAASQVESIADVAEDRQRETHPRPDRRTSPSSPPGRSPAAARRPGGTGSETPPSRPAPAGRPAASASLCASAVKGFSHSTCLPASSAGRSTGMQAVRERVVDGVDVGSAKSAS